MPKNPTPEQLKLCGQWMGRIHHLHIEGVSSPATVASQEMGLPEATLRGWTLSGLRHALRPGEVSLMNERVKSILSQGGADA